MSGNKVKMMCQGAMMASIFGVLGIINIYTGSTFDIIFSYVMTIALVLYTKMYDYKAGLSVTFVSFFVLFMVGQMFFTCYTSATLIMGVFYGYCLKHQKSNKYSKYGLMVISAIKNIIIFFLLGALLGIGVWQECLEIHQFIVSFIPFLNDILNPIVTFILLWLFMFFGESYIIRFYSNVLIFKMMKRKEI